MKRRKLLLIAAATIVALFFAGYFVAVRILFPPLPEPENGIVVPDLTGLTVAQAQDKLRPLGLRVSEVTDIAAFTQPPGLVIAQSPIAGQQLRELGAVRLAVSAGEPKRVAPPVEETPDSL